MFSMGWWLHQILRTTEWKIDAWDLGSSSLKSLRTGSDFLQHQARQWGTEWTSNTALKINICDIWTTKIYILGQNLGQVELVDFDKSFRRTERSDKSTGNQRWRRRSCFSLRGWQLLRLEDSVKFPQIFFLEWLTKILNIGQDRRPAAN